MKASWKAELRRAMRDCGITKKGEHLAEVVWRAADDIFAAAEPGDRFDVVHFVSALMRSKASDLDAADRKRDKRARRGKLQAAESRKARPATSR